MNDLLGEIRIRIAEQCFTGCCSGQGCIVSLSKVPLPYAVVDMDCPDLTLDPRRKRCDCIFFSDNGNWIVPIELKKGQPQADHIAQQLQASADFVASLLPRGLQVRFVPVAVFGGRLRPKQIRLFRELKVRFQEKRENIRLLKCGDCLTRALRLNG